MQNQKLVNYVNPTEDINLTWNDYREEYNLSFKIDETTYWISKHVITLDPRLENVYLEDITNGSINTASKYMTNKRKQTLVFVSKEGKLMREVEFKNNNNERFKIFKHLTIELNVY